MQFVSTTNSGKKFDQNQILSQASIVRRMIGNQYLTFLITKMSLISKTIINLATKEAILSRHNKNFTSISLPFTMVTSRLLKKKDHDVVTNLKVLDESIGRMSNQL